MKSTSENASQKSSFEIYPKIIEQILKNPSKAEVHTFIYLLESIGEYYQTMIW